MLWGLKVIFIRKYCDLAVWVIPVEVTMGPNHHTCLRCVYIGSQALLP